MPIFPACGKTLFSVLILLMLMALPLSASEMRDRAFYTELSHEDKVAELQEKKFVKTKSGEIIRKAPKGKFFIFFFFYTYLLFFAVLVWDKKRYLAIVCLAGWLVTLGMMLSGIFRYTYLLADNDLQKAISIAPWRSFAAQITIAVIMITLAKYMNRIQREKEHHLEDAVKRLTELNRLKESYSDQLKNEVKQRTLTLEQQAKQLASLDRAKSRFFSGISHEFRTPLTLISGPLQDVLSAKEELLSIPTRRTLSLAVNQSHHLLDLVEELLDLSRLEADTLHVAKAPLDLSHWLDYTASQFESLAKAQAIDLNMELPTHTCYVMADEKQLQKVINNLVMNAIKFTPASGSVLVQLNDKTDGYAIQVRDTGQGMTSEQKSIIFDRFYQSDPVSDGAGLGLFIAKEITVLHQGSLEVESTLGEGSCFTLWLPKANASDVLFTESQAPSSENIPALPEHNPNASGEITLSPETTVLVAEDNTALRRYIVGHLNHSYHVLEAVDGVEAFEAACHHTPDLIISDILMPNMDGIELCKKLKSHTDTEFIPLILLTALKEDDHKITGFDAQADDYIEKPFNANVLKSRVKNLIVSRRNILSNNKHSGSFMPSTDALINRDQQFADQLEKIISESLSDCEFSVEMLATKMAMERSTLFKKTQAVFDLSPSELISNARLNWAQDLLQTQQGSISDIAFTVGYASVSHFSYSFKKKHKVSPSTYRAQYVEKKALS